MELNDTELRKVQKVMMIFMSLWMLLDFSLLLLKQEPQIVVRILLTGLLFYFIYIGKNWARMLFLTFALLGILFGLFMSVILSFQNIGVGLFLLGFVMFLSILPCYLAFSKNAKKYFNGEAVVNN